MPLISIYPDGKIQLQNHAVRHLFAGFNLNKMADLRMFGEDMYIGINLLQVGKRQLVHFSCDAMERQLAVTMSQIAIADAKCESLVSLQDIQSELDSVQLQSWEGLVKVLTQLNDDKDNDRQAALQSLQDVHRAVGTVASFHPQTLILALLRISFLYE